MTRFWPLLLLTGCSQGPAITPGRVVSNNPCIDAVLEAVMPPQEIGAVSIWSQRAESASASVGWANQFPGIGADAEALINARPRLVLTGNLASTGTNEALSKAGVRVLSFGVPATVDESLKQVVSIAAAVGHEQEGRALAARLQAVTRQTQVRGKSAIIWQAGGFVPGEGSLQDELLQRAGFRNASSQYGLGQWDMLPLETVMRQPPDVIFMPASAAGDDGRTLALRTHILDRHPQTRLVSFPDELLLCGGPTMERAMIALRAAA